MLPRSTLVLDTGISLVATTGMRGLTHRGIDQLAGIPIGSTSNYFRTRSTLLIGVAERIFDLVNTQAKLTTSREGAATVYCTELVSRYRQIFRALLIFALDPSLPAEASASIQSARGHIVGTISERAELGGEAVNVLLGNLAVLLINDNDVTERVIDQAIMTASHRAALTD